MIIVIFLSAFLSTALINSQEMTPKQISINKTKYSLYPETLDEKPDIPSPYKSNDGSEIVLACLKDNTYALILVTVENVPHHINYGHSKIGKGKQLEIDADDFPSLSQTGLHSDKELQQTKTITGKPISEITDMGRPGKSSGVGFMAADEDIISVLKGDNSLVTKMGLTHSQMAKPLFHIWNFILIEYESGKIGRFWNNNIQYILYNGQQLQFGTVNPTRGLQESIFNDEIQGAFQINFYRELNEKEKEFLQKKYTHLTIIQMDEMIEKLSHILTGEMEPYYVMRYGFYEGHTDYRVDPIAIAFIFGLRSIEEIEQAFSGQLYNVLTQHFSATERNK
jgi:hypothetical protein